MIRLSDGMPFCNLCLREIADPKHVKLTAWTGTEGHPYWVAGCLHYHHVCAAAILYAYENEPELRNQKPSEFTPEQIDAMLAKQEEALKQKD